MEVILQQIEKMKYQIKLLGSSLDPTESPIASLVISMDWCDKDLNRAHDIFEKYDNKLRNKEDIHWSDLEFDFKDQFDIGYQTLKIIVLAFYRNYQWIDVCKAYAKAHECMEFHEITRA